VLAALFEMVSQYLAASLLSRCSSVVVCASRLFTTWKFFFHVRGSVHVATRLLWDRLPPCSVCSLGSGGAHRFQIIAIAVHDSRYFWLLLSWLFGPVVGRLWYFLIFFFSN